ncbi:unnamed protein product, partial [Closterium sp. NIES-65]
MELIMSRAKGRVYATKAAAYDEEERDEPLVNDELLAKAGTQKAIADAYCKENARRAGELKDCLVLITHLAKKASEVDAGALTWEVRSKLRNPCSNKAQFTRSGDPGALARQARVVQRWINASQVKREGECIGIGKLCIVGWTDISEEELAGDELGDLSPDDLVPTSAHRRVPSFLSPSPPPPIPPLSTLAFLTLYNCVPLFSPFFIPHLSLCATPLVLSRFMKVSISLAPSDRT